MGKRSTGRKEGLTGLFSPADYAQIGREGLSDEEVQAQLDLFRQGIPFLSLNRPCRVRDGIESIDAHQRASLVALHEEAAASGRFIKFVPASGAASRMFMEWYRFLGQEDRLSESEAEGLMASLRHYAFYEDLKKGPLAGPAPPSLPDQLLKVLRFVLDEGGLGYGWLPKALIKFHQYPDGGRTAIEEHLVEAALYVKDGKRNCRLHVTVSDNHRSLVAELLARVRPAYERLHDVVYEIGISVQGSATNTLAVDLENRPFRLDDGRLCFRPGGHGALLENLNALDAEIVFVKNIDNIVPDRLKAATVLYKKILGGLLVSVQREIFGHLQRLEKGKVDEGDLTAIAAFCRERLHTVFPAAFAAMPANERASFLFQRLNRPLRVCGMVKNEGEPGGGPFWVNEGDGSQSLQIVEAFQVDPASPEQKSLWESASHFNPVDLVCGIRDFRGEKFDLHRYVNPRAAAITRKTERGRDLKALEHPGLWNGAMAGWNTLFVKVPIETFNPVKTIDDLLRPTHQPG